MEGLVEESIESQGDRFLSYLDDEEGEITLQGKQDEREVPSGDQDIYKYYRQFVDFMQAKLHKKYDLRSSRKRTRVQEQDEESTSREQTPSSSASKGKKPL